MRKSKIILPILFILLLSGCGKEKTTEETNIESEVEVSTGITTIETVENIKFPVYEKDLAEETIYNPTLLNSQDDVAYFGFLNEGSTTGVALNYGYNSSDGYNTPYCFSDDTEALTELEYNYYDRNSRNYDTAVMTNTAKQFEFYKKDSFLYEFTSPSTPTTDSDIRSLSQVKDISKFAEVLDRIRFIHTDVISITSDLASIDNENLIIKYANIRINTFDESELYGVVAGIEYNDKQYFYLYAAAKEESDYKDIVSRIDVNSDFDINSLVSKSTGTKQITFDINGTAGTIEAPSYFRNEEIEGNIYSKALTYIPPEQRDEETPLMEIPEEAGSTEVYLTNEYYNLALTYNNYIIPEDCTSDYEMYVRALGVPYGLSYDAEVMMYGSIDNNEYIVPREDITDKDGNVWKSYYIMTSYKYEGNYPMIIPYVSPAVIYAHKLNNSYQIFTFSSALTKWWNNNDFVSSIDSVVASFSALTPNSTAPDHALSYYRTRKYDVNKEGTVNTTEETESTPTDATIEFHESGDIDEGPGHKKYMEDGTMQGTSTGDKEADKDGYTQEYIDTLPMLDDEVD